MRLIFESETELNAILLRVGGIGLNTKQYENEYYYRGINPAEF